MSSTGVTEAAYRRCESITRARAANFYYGIRLLPHDRRRGMCAVYAFARRVDDIGDGTLEPAEKLRRLDGEDEMLAALEAASAGEPQSSDPVIVALGDTYRRFSVPSGALGELIEGVRMDVAGTTYEGFDELVLYCRRVAGAIGRVCLPIFGSHDETSTAGSERRIARGRSRCGHAADQHPARRARGRGERSRVPAGRGSPAFRPGGRGR